MAPITNAATALQPEEAPGHLSRLFDQLRKHEYLKIGPPWVGWRRRTALGSVEPLFWTQAAAGVVWLLINSYSMGVRIASAE
jgi:hypothetical protein